jgi:hypothetical protein
MYKLFTDKSELFECDIKLQGASLKKSKARLVVETSDYSLMFNGNISKGNIRLEVIAEDTFFTPWESDFEVETSKKVTVEVKSQTIKKPIIEAKVKVTNSEQEHIVNLLKLLVNENINIKNISYKRNKLNNIVATYLKENTVKDTEKVINGVLNKLQKEK